MPLFSRRTGVLVQRLSLLYRYLTSVLLTGKSRQVSALSIRKLVYMQCERRVYIVLSVYKVMLTCISNVKLASLRVPVLFIVNLLID